MIEPMEPTTRLSFSVLVTREEYMAFAAETQRQARRRRLPFLYGAGGVLCVLGLAGLFFGSLVSLSAPAAVCLVVVGAFLVAYDGLFAPIMDKAAAAREYDEKEDLRMANACVFTGGRVQIRNGRMEGEIPLSVATRWYQTRDLFGLFFGRELSILLPKRLMDGEQCRQMEDLLNTYIPAKEKGRA